ncbi:sensor domain-containing diguanylate cyclase [Salinisphaera sp.]|uniref:sensor domain-containing diguanylate cyclase n=1 Tax=Salinisphaera sp. TaxID=1914330 RepID=UPI0025EE0CBE|nr:sensor domain-containing diguanylate cyclase [Salinisphaera sp.]
MKNLKEGRIADEALALDSQSLRVLLARVFAEVSEAVIVSDVDRQVVMTNEAANRLFRYTADEFAGLSTAELYERREDFEQLGATRYNAQADDARHTYLMRYRRRDGSVFEGETTAGAIRHGDRGTPLFLGIIRDVSSHIATNKVLHSLNQITSDPTRGFEQRRREIVELGVQHFAMAYGVVAKIDGQRYEVKEAESPDGSIAVGAIYELPDTYCYHVLSKRGPFGVHHAGESKLNAHPCYAKFRLESYLGAPITVDGRVYGVLSFSSSLPSSPFTQQDYDLIAMFAQWLGHEIAREQDLAALRHAHERLQTLATQDELTGLANRRLLSEQLDHELNRGQRYTRNLSVALIDFDHFKQLNDRYGHAAGDAALKLFADIARQTLRNSDTIGRWGGEEFLALLPETTLPAAANTLERLVARVRDTPLEIEGEQITLTVSAGVTCAQNDETPAQVLKRADDALYSAKDDGRDRVNCG